MLKNKLVILLLILFSTGIYAQVDHGFSISTTMGYSHPNSEGYNEVLPIPENFESRGDDNGREVGDSSPSPIIGFSFKHELFVPTVLGDLEVDNVLKINPKRGKYHMDLKLNMFPFLSLKSGISSGSGWSIMGMSSGLGTISSSGEVEDSGYNGIVFQHYYGVSLKMDVAAILPEENPWAHILLSFYPVMSHSTYTEAKDDELWYFGGRPGYNSWTFYTSSFLGYELPVSPIQLIGLSYITAIPVGEMKDVSPISENGWGSDFIEKSLDLKIVIPVDENNIIQVKFGWGNGIIYDRESINYNNITNRQSTIGEYWYFGGVQIGYKILL